MKENTTYFVNFENGKLSIYTKTKRFFGEKFNKVELKRFFTLGKESLSTGRLCYSIVPRVSGLSPQDYLYMKSDYNLKHKESDFGKRVLWDIADIEEECSTEIIEGNTYYSGSLTGKITITDTEENIIFQSDNWHFNYFDKFKMDAKFIKLLNQNACNGIYQTAREQFDLVTQFSEGRCEKASKLRCEVCDEIFDSIPEFFCHMIEENHYDSILDDFIYDPEVIRIKNLINKEEV